MTSHASKQIMTTHILSNISGIKGNQTIKSDQLTEYNTKIFYKNNHAENETGR